MRTVETVTKQIEELQTRLANVQGTQTEVYTRIVGYYRSLRNWNKGKREEYSQRLPFAASPPAEEKPSDPPAQACGEAFPHDIAGYRYFYRKSCPNCRPVREFVSRLPFTGIPIDVDTEDGFAQALAHDVQSTPTVVFYDNQNQAQRRYHSVRQLEEVFAGAL
jgi:ribonucleoside-triphosphate reductase